MKIGLYNLEPRVKNLALEKLRLYYQGRGDKVADCLPVETNGFDVVYASAIFDWTSQEYVSPQMITGGTGFDLITTLPPEIEAIQPRLNFGFTTRGCIRKCPFCVVPKKEGKIRVVGDLLNLWDGKAKQVVLYDNNILALPEHFAFICEQARQYNLKLDFNQGLDHRLLTSEIIDIMLSIRHHEYRFAFDYPSYVNSVDKALRLLQSKGINRCSWYVLVGFDTTFKEDLFRLNYLRNRNQIAYVQRYRAKKKKKKLGREYVALARWANQHHIYRGMTWEQFLAHPDNKTYRYLLAHR